MATVTDRSAQDRWEAENAAGSLIVESSDLASLTALQKEAWLITLNCCEGSAAVEGVGEGFHATRA